MNNVNALNYQNIDHGVAFKMGNNILDKWGCTSIQKQTILGVTKSSFHRYQNDSHSVKLNNDQLERLSYLANIHQALRMVFTNPDNIYGFMKMENDNPYFNGRSPLSIIDTGNFGALYEVFKRIDYMRNGQW